VHGETAASARIVDKKYSKFFLRKGLNPLADAKPFNAPNFKNNERSPTAKILATPMSTDVD